jgi:hypothetical protein
LHLGSFEGAAQSAAAVAGNAVMSEMGPTTAVPKHLGSESASPQ